MVKKNSFVEIQAYAPPKLFPTMGSHQITTYVIMEVLRVSNHERVKAGIPSFM